MGLNIKAYGKNYTLRKSNGYMGVGSIVSKTGCSSECGLRLKALYCIVTISFGVFLVQWLFCNMCVCVGGGL